MSAATIDVAASALEDIAASIELPCEANAHDPAHPPVAAWWSRMTHAGCPKVEVTAVCNHCKVHDELFTAWAMRARAKCSCTCGRTFLATDLEISFTPIRCGP